MEKITWKPTTTLAPIPPVMVTCGTMSDSNIITIAWTGIVNTIPPMTYISVRKQRHSYEIIKQSGEFVINLTTKELVRAADFCGVRSGTNLDKFNEMGLKKGSVSILQCPCIEESPINLECRVKQIIELGSHDMFLAEIVAVNVSSELIDESGKLRLDKASLCAFAHGEYFELGQSLGTFGFSVQKKKKRNTTPRTVRSAAPVHHKSATDAPFKSNSNKSNKPFSKFHKQNEHKHKFKEK